MRHFAALGVGLCLLGWLGVACQRLLPTPTSTPSPAVTPSATGTPSPTVSPSPTCTRTPTPTPGVLTDAEAIVLTKEALAARGVAIHTLRITIGGEPRWASVRYTSSYDVDGRAFQAQTVLVNLAVARVMTRVDPPIDGGVRLAVIPGGEGEVGLRVTHIEGQSLRAWANGSLSDQEFVSEWTVGAATRE
jgi:hypothetical protein